MVLITTIAVDIDIQGDLIPIFKGKYGVEEWKIDSYNFSSLVKYYGIKYEQTGINLILMIHIQQ